MWREPRRISWEDQPLDYAFKQLHYELTEGPKRDFTPEEERFIADTHRENLRTEAEKGRKGCVGLSWRIAKAFNLEEDKLGAINIGPTSYLNLPNPTLKLEIHPKDRYQIVYEGTGTSLLQTLYTVGHEELHATRQLFSPPCLNLLISYESFINRVATGDIPETPKTRIPYTLEAWPTLQQYKGLSGLDEDEPLSTEYGSEKLGYLFFIAVYESDVHRKATYTFLKCNKITESVIGGPVGLGTFILDDLSRFLGYDHDGIMAEIHKISRSPERASQLKEMFARGDYDDYFEVLGVDLKEYRRQSLTRLMSSLLSLRFKPCRRRLENLYRVMEKFPKNPKLNDIKKLREEMRRGFVVLLHSKYDTYVSAPRDCMEGFAELSLGFLVDLEIAYRLLEKNSLGERIKLLERMPCPLASSPQWPECSNDECSHKEPWLDTMCSLV